MKMMRWMSVMMVLHLPVWILMSSLPQWQSQCSQKYRCLVSSEVDHLRLSSYRFVGLMALPG